MAARFVPVYGGIRQALNVNRKLFGTWRYPYEHRGLIAETGALKTALAAIADTYWKFVLPNVPVPSTIGPAESGPRQTLSNSRRRQRRCSLSRRISTWVGRVPSIRLHFDLPPSPPQEAERLSLSDRCVFVDHDWHSQHRDTIPSPGELSVNARTSEQLQAAPCYARYVPDSVGPRPPEPFATIAKTRGGAVTTSSLYYFVDTNLFIQCQAPERLDWSPWHEFEEVRLIVSTPVLREIDWLKIRGGRVGNRARATSAMFRQMLGQPHKVVHAQSPRVVLSVEPQHTYPQDLADRLNYAERDDQLVGTVRPPDGC